jgi:hypothetical protein
MIVRKIMNRIKHTVAVVFILISCLNAHNIEVITHGLTKYEPVGTLEIVIYFEVVNVSPDTQVVFEVRTMNNVPSGWNSQMCFGSLCFPPEIDSIITAPPFPEPPLAPNDTLYTSLHVFTDQVTIGTAYVQIQIGAMSEPGERTILNLTLTTDPSVSVSNEHQPNNYFLEQNYPNPFNPSTQISYGVKEGGFVSLKVYNILGAEIATLENEYRTAGVYAADFNSLNLSSGVYLYRLSVNNFVQTRKMILEK